ncbi:MAG: flagellar biosynthetic protein FliO [Oscillospiraceae bacterium]|nr:flagellar biosynthetic protein FliO [Oscillospiraceae bacterium]
MFGEVFTVICALLGVIGLMILGFYAARWLNKRFNIGGFSTSGQRTVKIIEYTGIAQDKQLMIVSVGKKIMLLGVTPTSVNKICDLDEEDLAVPDGEDAESGSGFMQSLKKAFAEKNQDAGNKSEKDLRNEKDDF